MGCGYVVGGPTTTITVCPRNEATTWLQPEALFVMLGSIRSRIHFLRPFYALDGIHTRSQYNLTLLIAVRIDAEDRILPFAWALVPSENETWWTWFCEHLFEAFNCDDLTTGRLNSRVVERTIVLVREY